MGKDGTIPEGQGIVMAHLNECHELLEMVSTHNSIFPLGPKLLTTCVQLKESMENESDEEDEEEEDEEEEEDAEESEGFEEIHKGPPDSEEE